MTDLTAAALDYLRRGHHLLALQGKRPSNRYHAKPDDDTPGWSWERSIFGVPETEEEQAGLAQVFEDPAVTGIAILIPQHMLVADVDTEEAAVLFMELVGEAPETVSVKTTKGLHLWFYAPGAEQSVWIGGRTLLFKGFGGYVAAPPSAHFNSDGVKDGVYTWIRDFSTPVDDLPDPIAERMRFERALDRLEPIKTAETGRYLVVPTDSEGHWTRQGWASWHIDGLVRAVKGAGEGNRNNMLAWAAMQAAEEGVPLATAMPLLTAAAREAGLTDRETRVTIKAAFTRRGRG